MKVRNLLILIIISFTFSPAYATLLYNADASSSFTLVSSGGMTVSAEPRLEMPMSSTSGSGTASIDADTQSILALTPFIEGDTLTQASEVSGSAGPTPGASSASSMNAFLITLDNSLGTSDAIAEFSFSYSWLVEVFQTDPLEALMEAGFASAFFHLDGFAPSGAETLAVDLGAGAMPVMDFLFNPLVSFDFSDVGASSILSGSTTITAFVFVPMGSTDQFSVITDAVGAAAHIPEPASLLLLALGVTVLWRKRPY